MCACVCVSTRERESESESNRGAGAVDCWLLQAVQKTNAPKVGSSQLAGWNAGANGPGVAASSARLLQLDLVPSCGEHIGNLGFGQIHLVFHLEGNSGGCYRVASVVAIVVAIVNAQSYHTALGKSARSTPKGMRERPGLF